MNDATQSPSRKPRQPCAVYCRVSTDERLDQEFNSIDAQQEAGHGDGDGPPERRVGPAVPGRAPSRRQSDDRAHRHRPRRRDPGHQGEVAGAGLGRPDWRVRPAGDRRRTAGGGGPISQTSDDALETFVPLVFRPRGVQRVATDDRPIHDATLLDALARAFYWQHLLDIGRMGSGADIARAEELDQSVANVLLRLRLLAPDIIEPMMAGTQPRTLNLRWLQRYSLPVDWAAQRALMKQFEGAL